MSSIFTRIINREIPSSIVYEDDICIAILDINPIQKGHILVIPKEELLRMDDYSDETVSYCMIVAKQLMKHMKTVLSDIHYVYLAVEGLEVPHRHTHLIPYAKSSVDSSKFDHVQYDDGEKQLYLDLLKIETLDLI